MVAGHVGGGGGGGGGTMALAELSAAEVCTASAKVVVVSRGGVVGSGASIPVGVGFRLTSMSVRISRAHVWWKPAETAVPGVSGGRENVAASSFAPSCGHRAVHRRRRGFATYHTGSHANSDPQSPRTVELVVEAVLQLVEEGRRVGRRGASEQQGQCRRTPQQPPSRRERGHVVRRPVGRPAA